MEARANIVLNYGAGEEIEHKGDFIAAPDRKIYLYSHWGGESIGKDLKQALKREQDRWNDPSYLARIIFSELVQSDILGDTGYGISPYLTDNEYPLIEVDLENHTVTIEGKDSKTFSDGLVVKNTVYKLIISLWKKKWQS